MIRTMRDTQPERRPCGKWSATGMLGHVDLEPFEALPEGWNRALCMVAHPDDMEFGAAAAVARWTGQGKEVVYCLVTSGEAGIHGMSPDECRVVREAEQVASAEIVGVGLVEFLGLPDGIVEYLPAAASYPRGGGAPAPPRRRGDQQLPGHLGRS